MRDRKRRTRGVCYSSSAIAQVAMTSTGASARHTIILARCKFRAARYKATTAPLQRGRVVLATNLYPGANVIASFSTTNNAILFCAYIMMYIIHIHSFSLLFYLVAPRKKYNHERKLTSRKARLFTIGV